MKVEKLIKILSKLDPKAEVILSSDMEGNYFSVLDSIDSDNVAYNKKEGHVEVGIKELTQEMADLGYTQEDVAKKPCVILFP